MITRDQIEEWLEAEGARAVHRQWRDMMLEQGREVAPERMEWDTLSEQDKALDAEIALEVVLQWQRWTERGNPAP